MSDPAERVIAAGKTRIVVPAQDGRRALILRHLVVLLAALLSCGCAVTPAVRCAGGQEPAIQELVYFGAQTPDGEVTAGQWTSFLAEVVTPRFPAGFTTWEADGQWRSADGSLTREPARVLNLVHAGDPIPESAVIAIIEAYKTRYRQEAVLRVRAPVCVSF